MEIHSILGIASALFFIIAYIPYVISIVRGKTKPHPFSWFLWWFIGTITLFFYIKAGAIETLPLAVSGAIFPFIIFILSVRYWNGIFSRFDYFVLFTSLISIALYVIFRSADISLTISIVADMFAFMPTIKKTYTDPSSESFLSWMIFLTSYILSVFAISKWTYGVSIFPCYLLFFGILMCLLILRGRLKKA